MPTTFADICAQVKYEANKGSAYDAIIPNKVRSAIDFIEKNYTLKYMERFVRFQVVAGGLEPGPYTLVENYKSISMVRFKPASTNGAGVFDYLDACDPQDVAQVKIAKPTRYWVDNEQWMWFDNIPAETLNAQLMYARYIGQAENDTTSWLFDHGFQAVVFEAMLELMPTARQPLWKDMYQPEFDKQLRVLLLADEEARRANTNVTMGMYR